MRKCVRRRCNGPPEARAIDCLLRALCPHPTTSPGHIKFVFPILCASLLARSRRLVMMRLPALAWRVSRIHRSAFLTHVLLPSFLLAVLRPTSDLFVLQVYNGFNNFPLEPSTKYRLMMRSFAKADGRRKDEVNTVSCHLCYSLISMKKISLV